MVLFLQAILYRHCPSRRMQVVKLSRKVFQSIYTTVYLTSVMRNIIAAAQPPDRVPLMVVLRLDLDLGRDLGNKLFLEDESIHDRTLHYRPEGKHMTIKGGREFFCLRHIKIQKDAESMAEPCPVSFSVLRPLAVQSGPGLLPGTVAGVQPDAMLAPALPCSVQKSSLFTHSHYSG